MCEYFNWHETEMPSMPRRNYCYNEDLSVNLLVIGFCYHLLYFILLLHFSHFPSFTIYILHLLHTLIQFMIKLPIISCFIVGLESLNSNAH